MSSYSHYGYQYYPRQLSVAERRQKAAKALKGLEKEMGKLQPVVIEGRQIANSWWGKAWCDNLESYRDFAYRLERGRSYVRHGSVIHLEIGRGIASARVVGTHVYEVEVKIAPLPPVRWEQVIGRCAGEIGSLVELLRGGFSEEVMKVLTARPDGLFPWPKEIQFSCSCPDEASMCKHVAAVMYGIGARLDSHPDLFFRLRDVDETEMVARAISGNGLFSGAASAEGGSFGDTTSGKVQGDAPVGNLGAIFGIDIESGNSKANVAEKAMEEAEPVGVAKPARSDKLARMGKFPKAENVVPITKVAKVAKVNKVTKINKITKLNKPNKVARVGKQTTGTDSRHASKIVSLNGSKAAALLKHKVLASKVSRKTKSSLGGNALSLYRSSAQRKGFEKSSTERLPELITVSQLKALGIPYSRIYKAVIDGNLRPTIFRGEYKSTPTTSLWLRANGIKPGKLELIALRADL